MPTRFDLVIDGKRLTPTKLATFLQEFTAYVAEVDRELSETRIRTIDLVITSLSYNSPARIGFSARARPTRTRRRSPVQTQRLVRACAAGIRMVERGQERPQSLTDDALGHLQRISQELSEEIPRVRMEVPIESDTPAITKVTAENVERLLRYEYSLGSIEGKLDALNVHDAPLFTVWDAVSNRAVRCYFNADDLPLVQSSLQHKVIVNGRIRRDEEGRPNQIRPVQSFRTIDSAPSEEVPSPTGLFEGLGDSRSYLAELRGE